MGGAARDHRLTYLQTFTCTTVAGVTSRSLTAPLDVIKVLSQVGTKETKQGFFKAFVNLYQSQGLRAFWKGNLIGCLRLSPFSTIQFSAFYKLKSRLADENGRMSPPKALLAGSLGGMVATVVTYPTDMVKTRLIVQSTNKQRRRYRGIVHAFKLILKEEGLLAFYRGLYVSLLGSMPFSACTFLIYELLDTLWDTPRYMLTPVQNFFNGCIAAAVAQTVSFPFDTIRKKLQAQSFVMKNGGGVDIHPFRGMIMAFRKTNDAYGMKGLWRGNTANICKIAPYAGLMFMAYEACKRGFLFQNGYTQSLFDDTPLPGVDQTLKPDEVASYVPR
ncbi:solute carrier family 25 member 43-like [Acanthaster planci]|uniref:Solute carrier family 25 member 43-like n=1 Tax=Acanthaster planci TaxID=133434 RepID=A0A8B7Z1N3_ACAPL|nr:solute carrier family 25 member 43-like [Acanthaster planci]